MADFPIAFPLETPENQRLSGVLRGYKMEALARNGLNAGLTIYFSSL